MLVDAYFPRVRASACRHTASSGGVLNHECQRHVPIVMTCYQSDNDVPL